MNAYLSGTFASEPIAMSPSVSPDSLSDSTFDYVIIGGLGLRALSDNDPITFHEPIALGLQVVG